MCDLIMLSDPMSFYSNLEDAYKKKCSSSLDNAEINAEIIYIQVYI